MDKLKKEQPPQREPNNISITKQNQKNEKNHKNDKKQESPKSERSCGSEDEDEKTKIALIQALRLELRSHKDTMAKLQQLHTNYGQRIKTLKQETKQLKQQTHPKVSTAMQPVTDQQIATLTAQLATLNQQYQTNVESQKEAKKQLDGIRKENEKLAITINALNPELAELRVQYEALCNRTEIEMKKTSSNLQDHLSSDCSPAENVVALLQYFDITLADQLVTGSITPKITTDPWFREILEENQMLERKIRILLYLMNQEKGRCNLRAMIKGNPIYVFHQDEYIPSGTRWDSYLS